MASYIGVSRHWRDGGPANGNDLLLSWNEGAGASPDETEPVFVLANTKAASFKSMDEPARVGQKG
jgi:hypothetical protein